MKKPPSATRPKTAASAAKATVQNTCPVCGAALVSEKCKVVCRSSKCVYRIIFNCSEF